MLCQRYHYYIYPTLSGGGDGQVSARHLRALFRTALYFRGKGVLVKGCPDATRVQRVLASASGSAKIPSGPTVCLIGLGEGCAEVENIWNGMDSGMLFTDAAGMNILVNLADRKLPHQKFDILLP